MSTNPKTIIVNVKAPSGQGYIFQAHIKNTVDSIKRVLAKAMELDPNLINLALRGLPLDGKLTFGELNITDQDYLQWILPDTLPTTTTKPPTMPLPPKPTPKIEEKPKSKPKRQKSDKKLHSDSNSKDDYHKLVEKTKFMERADAIRKIYVGPVFAEEPHREKPEDYEYRVQFLQNMCLPVNFIPAALEMANYDLEVAADALVNGDLPGDNDYSDTEVEEMYDHSHQQDDTKTQNAQCMDKETFMKEYKSLRKIEQREVTLLRNLGVDIENVLRVYLACDKDKEKTIEQLASNLFD